MCVSVLVALSALSVLASSLKRCLNFLQHTVSDVACESYCGKYTHSRAHRHVRTHTMTCVFLSTCTLFMIIILYLAFPLLPHLIEQYTISTRDYLGYQHSTPPQQQTKKNLTPETDGKVKLYQKYHIVLCMGIFWRSPWQQISKCEIHKRAQLPATVLASAFVPAC